MTSDDGVPRLTVLDFGADWCGACRLIEPVLERVVAADGAVELRKIDVADEAALAEQMCVKALPTLIVLDQSGQERRRMTGALTSRGIEEAIARVRAEIRTA